MRTFIFTLAVIITLSSFCNAQDGTQKANDKTKPVVSPDSVNERLTPPDTDKRLTELLESFVKQMELYAQIRKDLEANLDGTPKSAMLPMILDILATEDFAKAGSALTGATEDHRNSLGVALATTINNLSREQASGQKLEQDIQQLVELIQSGTIPEDEIASKKRILLTVALHSKDKQTSIARQLQDIGFYKTQLKFLVGLERQFDDMSAERKKHIERVRDALKSEQRSQIPMSLRKRQAELTQAIGYLKSVKPPKFDLPSTEGNNAERRGTGLESAVEQMRKIQRPFTEEENALLEEVINRSGNKNGN